MQELEPNSPNEEKAVNGCLWFTALCVMCLLVVLAVLVATWIYLPWLFALPATLFIGLMVWAMCKALRKDWD